MLIELNNEQHYWVEDTLKSMTMEQCIGHLLCPEDRNYTEAEWRDIFKKVPLGSVFFGGGSRDELMKKCQIVQSVSRLPVMIAADMEFGACAIKTQSTKFPVPMACSATNDPELMYQLGRITALESRSCGIHWTFSPIADLNLNFNNPLVNTRSLGDNPDHVIPLLQALIRGLQQDGLMAATVKHFPGDGVDDRDQHLCTTVNSLPFGQWMELYGRVWQAAFDAGSMSVMAGHISLPDWQKEEPDLALPATLCPKLQIDLLRKQLNFKGLLVSDGIPMIGITSRCIDEELAWRNIAAGSDMVLFSKPIDDFNYLMEALRKNKLSEERVYDAVRHVLENKARLNLHHDPFGVEFSEDMLAGHANVAEKMAEKSITQVRVRNELLPVHLSKGSKVLTVTVSEREHRHEIKDLPVIDEELGKRGLTVDHLLNPSHRELRKLLPEYNKIFVNFYNTTWMRHGTMRMSNVPLNIFWHSFALREPDKTVFSSFGNPYVLYEAPHINNLLLAYCPDDSSQRAAVKVWLGELPPQGMSPVQMPQVKIKHFELNY